jgi:hypothetical protein
MRKKILITVLGMLCIFIVSCFGPNPPDDLSLYKGIAWADLPNKCINHGDDVCALFDCMVDRCWCDDSSPELPVLLEKEGITIRTEQEAAEYITEIYLTPGPSEISMYKELKRVVKLNDIFFNVFIIDGPGNEHTLTLAVDGTVIKTICGV